MVELQPCCCDDDHLWTVGSYRAKEGFLVIPWLIHVVSRDNIWIVLIVVISERWDVYHIVHSLHEHDTESDVATVLPPEKSDRKGFRLRAMSILKVLGI